MMKFLAVLFLSTISFAAPIAGSLSLTCITQPNSANDVFEYGFNLVPSTSGYYLSGDSSVRLKNINYKFDVRHLGVSKVSVNSEQITLDGELVSPLEGTVTTNNFVVDQRDGQMVHRRSIRVLKPHSKPDPEKELFMAVEGTCTIRPH